ncbi:MAG: response regulator [Myxococcales bacterium]|nr:response regulator [Myxococcales bacterium]
MRKCLAIAFEGTELTLITCESAAELLAKMKSVKPALVIADISLPQPDGYQLCMTLKLGSPKLPVLLLSSKQRPFDPERGSQADGHIEKPFDTQALFDKCKELCPVAEAAPPVLRAAGQPTLRGISLHGGGNVDERASHTDSRKTVPFSMPMDGGMSGESSAGLGIAQLSASPGIAQRGSPTGPLAVMPSSGRQRDALSTTIAFGETDAFGQPLARRQPAAEAAVRGAGELTERLAAMGLSREQIAEVVALSRDAIERVVWEVVPTLAETIIREEIRRLTSA